ncbi:MFS transporter [Haliea atlantica]
MLARLAPELRQYLVVTGNYWAFTLTDGALRMLVVLHFHGLGYSPLEIALLFLFYEIFGVVTNLLGGWLGAHVGLNRTMQVGLILQVLALAMLLVPAAWLTVPWVMAAQALSGIAKDLNKMSAKSAIKLHVPKDAQGTLYKWVALLTGSKNALKGAGFFLGGVLLMTLGFAGAVAAMAVALSLVWLLSLLLLKQELGRAKQKPRFRDLLSKSPAINVLSAARLCLFGARDVWFVVALPVFLSQSLGWNHSQTGGFLALWVIGYGLVQALAPRITGSAGRGVPDGRAATRWAALLTLLPGAIALGLWWGMDPATALVGGLLLFGAVFAVNASLHSYLIVSYADRDGVSLDVGFYYMSNALGRLLGTLLSGWLFQWAGQGSAGLQACLWVSAALLCLATLISRGLPTRPCGSARS